ncbi:hypothetical protein ACWGCW_00870 [Streptomyces sp. NPDC054933]
MTVKLDWDAGHGPVSGPINAAGGALAVAWAGHAAHMPPSWASLAAGAGWVGTYIAGRRRKVSGSHQTLRAAAWLAAGGWCSASLATGPWTQWGIGSLVAGAVGLGCAMAGAHHHDEKVAEKEAAAEAAARRATLEGKAEEIAKEWEDRIARVCHAGVHIVNVEDWKSEQGKPSGGFTIDGECGPGGTKWRDFKAFEDALASDAKLPEGCGVEVGPGTHRGAFLINVATVNRLVGEDPYPADYSPLSLNGPLPLGVFRDGTAAAPCIRQLTTLLTGRKGSGKTNLSNEFLAGVARMTDNMAPWVIDLNGGGLALPWLHAWHVAGRPGRPPIDWVADTPEKALAMAKAALRIAKARKPGYNRLEIEANDDKLPVSPQVPGILIAGDEIAEIYSPKARQNPVLKETGDILVQVVELARAVAVNALITALRATQDVLSEPQLLHQSGLKIGMKSDERELAHLFGWNDKLSPEDAPYPGCGFMKVLDEPARPFKAYRMLPNQIRDIVVATANFHPELDDLSRRTAGEDYERRWEGMDHLFGVGDAPAQVAVEQEPAASERPRGSGVTAGWGQGEPVGGDAQAAIDQAEEARRKLRDAMDEASNRDPDLDKQFDDIITGGGIDWAKPAAPTEQPVLDLGKKKEDPRKQIVVDIVTKAGSTGIGPEAIRDGITRLHPDVDPPHAATIGRWLDADPRIHKPSYGRYAVRPDQTGA